MGSEFTKLFELIISASLINNFVFTRFLGLCIFFGVSKKMETAVGMSITFTAVMMISAAISWVVFNGIMIPLDITFLKIIVFIGVVAGFVQAADTIMRKVSPGLYYKLGIYLALISTNCIILAVPLINAGEKYSFIQSLAFAFGSGLGFALALVIMASIREKLELADVPIPFRGLPIAFIVAGLVALAFTGFSGLITL
ncbi:MAG: electron transport complex subunit RsxA [Nitrospirae bacterium CG_4_10_14_3_um_filter_44_29]|nr:electron transport complex subunit RsxA [Nitrospirota bacterium]OIO30343.1 MAG: electron transport complex subunit RsxA [Nitrospirae bacterium CG1_02_44_142]PIP71226.1 MAG: electron transport complex subunit RsxA [Nitrospirae bacterium CG22_combo_CG10-13_8_21_14_all_44_11]PIV40393.1 MAG: electron transport complex subunit RsxA [Nitrospirae bacterium CG02_land_8_20_14_3_00_44_33]PIV65825.1 MAG: electron transport complex subunit RsxA [Nitrospirae bacterium CG01_land_8_20_14_3_00_44_22]PIW904